MQALFILAYIVTEDENEELNTTSENIVYVIKVLGKTLENPEQSDNYSAHYDLFAVEVVEAVEHLAANENNKVGNNT